ncbi:MAG: hypothetical protein NT038_08745 [Euryarchaeota archaeon]|nr:hypothetical protein [Euryarchaeota archaeon]
MEEPIVTRKTADMAAYMRQYRLANLDKCRAQDREQYHAIKHKRYYKFFTPEELEKYDKDTIITIGKERARMERAKNIVFNALSQYPNILNDL